MCGRVAADYDEILPAARDTELAPWISGVPSGHSSHFNIAPTQAIPIACTVPETGEPRFETAFWSLIPPWATELTPKFPTFNARIESVRDKRTFAPALPQQRCAVVISNFYEWIGPKQHRVPHAIFGPRPILPLAGLYSWWHDPKAPRGHGWHLTATVLTQESAGAMSGIHTRMPVLLTDEMTRDWLDPSISGVDLLEPLARSSTAAAANLREYQVRPLRGDGPELLEPAAAPPLFE